MFTVNDRVRRLEAEGENNQFTTLATVLALHGDTIGLNYDERGEPDVIHGWWAADSLTFDLMTSEEN